MKNNFYQSLRSFLLLAIVMLGSFSSFAQDRKVTGKVSGTDSQGIPGVSILVKGTNTGATTDVNGAFSVTVKSATAVLNITAVGYKSQSITVGSQSSINVTLAEDNSQLDEVIVTGYSVTNKKESTAAASIVKAKDLQIAPSGNVEQQLQGRVAGVTLITNGQPGTNSIIRVRGFGAFGGNEPLYVVDGVPVDVDNMNSINPADIEGLTILKDAAAAALYGSRGANGVVIITTKKGKNKNSAVSIDTRSGFAARAVKDYDFIKNEAKYYEAYYQGLKNTYMFNVGQDAATASQNAVNNLITGDQGLQYNAFNTPNNQLIDFSFRFTDEISW